MHTIKLVIRAGVAEVDHATIPDGIAVEVDDQDQSDPGGDNTAIYTKDGLVQVKL